MRNLAGSTTNKYYLKSLKLLIITIIVALHFLSKTVIFVLMQINKAKQIILNTDYNIINIAQDESK